MRAKIQRELLDKPVPAPRTVALDAAGQHCGFPAHLMTLLPGAVDLSRTDQASLEDLADVLATIHQVRPRVEVRRYQSWAWEAKFVVPSWAQDPGLWSAAFARLSEPPPGYVSTFIHRDFQPRNVLWVGESVTGVVDWVETSMGPAWLDVAHCASNLSISHGTDLADTFSAAYAARAGMVGEPYFDVMDIVGFLPPPPGRPGFFDDQGPENRRLEQRLHAVMG